MSRPPWHSQGKMVVHGFVEVQQEACAVCCGKLLTRLPYSVAARKRFQGSHRHAA